MRRIYSYLILTSIVLISTIVLWLSVGFLTIYKHYDGPLYIIPAKTFYNPKEIDNLHVTTGSPNNYFAAHLPLYPLLIRGFKELLNYGLQINELAYLKSMVLVNLISTIGLVLFFYYLLKKFKLTNNPLVLASVLLFLPRFLAVRTVGAPESLFLLMILLSLFFFEKQKFWWAGLFGGLATMTKTPGILLFAGYGLVFVERFIKIKKVSWQWLGIILIPLGLLGVFGLYAKQYGEHEDLWYTTGLLHDLDYDKYPDAHPNESLKWFADWGYPTELIDAVSAHAFGSQRTNTPPKTKLDYCLIACDELSGLLYAYSLMRPEGFVGMKPKSVKKKFKDKSFAAKIDRAEIMLGVDGMELDLGDHMSTLIAVFQEIEELKK